MVNSVGVNTKEKCGLPKENGFGDSSIVKLESIYKLKNELISLFDLNMKFFKIVWILGVNPLGEI